MSKEDELKNIQESFNKSANLLIEEIKKKIPIIVHSKVEKDYDQIIKKLNAIIKESSDNTNNLIDALVDVVAHVMLQNKILLELLIKRKIVKAKDVRYLEKRLDKRIHSTIEHVNKAVGRNQDAKE